MRQFTSSSPPPQGAGDTAATSGATPPDRANSPDWQPGYRFGGAAAPAGSAAGSNGNELGPDVRISIPLDDVLGGFLEGVISRIGPDIEAMLQEMRAEGDRPDNIDEEELKNSLNDFVKWLGARFGFPSDSTPSGADGRNSSSSGSVSGHPSKWSRKDENSAPSMGKEEGRGEDDDDDFDDEDDFDDDDFDDFSRDDFSID